MSDPQGDKLYLNLAASQTRKRLKGRGLGVRKVQSCGRKQSLVIHTATGKHLEQLKALFADANPTTNHDALDEPIANLRNLGPTSAQWLNDCGLQTIADLRNVGAITAFQLVCQATGKRNLNLLWALHAGLSERDWRELSQVEKDELLNELSEFD